MLTHYQRVKVCQVCQHRKMNAQIGMVCGLTDRKPDFVDRCPTYMHDQREAERLAGQESRAQDSFESNANIGAQSPGTTGGGSTGKVLGGIGLIVLAIVWFFGGLAVDRIFFYPIFLVVAGVVMLIKGAGGSNSYQAPRGQYVPPQPQPPQPYVPPQQRQVPPAPPHPGTPPPQPGPPPGHFPPPSYHQGAPQSPPQGSHNTPPPPPSQETPPTA